MFCKTLSRGASRPLFVALLALGGAVSASAQSVTVRGVVEDQGATFVLDCTPVTLTSATVNLNALLGLEVQAVGTVIAGSAISVTSAVTVTDIFEIGGGNPKIGGDLRLEATGPAGRVEQFYFALGNGFAVTHKMGWFLNASAQFLAQGVIPAAGKLQITLPIPNEPLLIGLDLYFQDVRFTAGQPAQLGNADCVTLQA